MTYGAIAAATEAAFLSGWQKGIDVSSVQSAINWAQVADAGITFAYLKCTEGLAKQADSRYRANVIGARNAGVRIGAYHFGKPSLSPGMSTVREDAIAECHRFAELCDLLGSQPGEMPPALDIEALCGMTEEQAAEWVGVWLDESDKLWSPGAAIVYAVRYTPDGKGGTTSWERVFRKVPGIAQRKLWMAQYPQRQDGPAVSFERAKEIGGPSIVPPWKDWWIWQFSGGGPNMAGNRVPGVPWLVDCNWLKP